MKKLLTILAASAMFFAFGDEPTLPQGADFEGYTAVGEGSFDPLGVDPGTESQYWYSASSDGNVISNHVVAPALPTGVTRPEMFKDNTNTNFLYLETEAPLFRTVAPNSHNTEFTGVSINTGDGIYLDTLVKFTAADSAFESLEDAADKIAIEYVEHEEESHEEGGNTIIDSAGFTNFVVRAGYLSSPLSQTNYVVNLPANFDKDAWHRLTVRSFGSIDAAGDVGFVIYLDGVALEYDAATVDVGPNFTPTGAAAAFYTDSFRALFPSAVQSGANKSTIAAVAFSGNGSIDDVVFTTTMPTFIKNSEAVRTEITLGTGVSNVTVTVASTSYEAAETNDTTFVFNLPAGTTSFVLGVTPDSDNGYSFDETTGITLTDATYDAATDTVTITGTSPALTVVGKRDNVTYIDGEGNPQSSPSLATAIAGAGNNTTITLAYSINVADVEGTGFVTYQISNKNIVLDLNGNTITWNDDVGENSLFTITSGTTFRVIDSSVANTGAIVYTGDYVVFYNKGDCYIGATTGDKGPTIQGKLAQTKAEPQIVRGKFDKTANTKSAEFMWNDYIEEGSALVESLGDYWIVEPSGSGSNWPSTWNGGTQPASMATAFDNWINAGNDPTAANAEAAFLVGVDVADYTNDLAVASITITGGNVVITGNYNLSAVNGALSVKMGDAPNALTTTTAVTAAEGAISLTPALGETKKFYQLVIGYPAN